MEDSVSSSTCFNLSMTADNMMYSILGGTVQGNLSYDECGCFWQHCIYYKLPMGLEAFNMVKEYAPLIVLMHITFDNKTKQVLCAYTTVTLKIYTCRLYTCLQSTRGVHTNVHVCKVHVHVHVHAHDKATHMLGLVSCQPTSSGNPAHCL